ncbi:MAG: class I tRNA ligase family protein [Proteobacteria bacterium]|nr:class I tRNA ligase family protein [Pseudomonadota bacterium]
MSQFLDLPRDSRAYLLVPSMPTPNGRLHLGHIAGPFLKLDVIARHLRSQGARARVLSGVDSYESHVLLHEGRPAAEVAAHYTQGIIEDLRALELEQDGFIDPLVSPGKELYDQTNLWVLHRLIEVGAAVYRKQKYPYSPVRRGYIPRSYIVGRCPGCTTKTAGSVCEACSHQHLSGELLEPRLRDGDSNIEWREVECLVMRVQDKESFLRKLDQLALPERSRAIVYEHITRFGGEMELTVPGDWGIPWRHAPDNSEQVIFSYGVTYPWSLAEGELFRRQTGGERNALEVDSDIVTVIAYGVDVTVCFVFGTAGFAWEDGKHKPFDYYLGNEFLNLHGEKFSTSRRHVISGTMLTERTPATSDAIRYYLATISPDDEETDFNIDDFIRTVNDELIEGLQATVERAFARLPAKRPERPPEAFVAAFRAAMVDMRARFELSSFRLHKVPPLVGNWMRIVKEVTEAAEEAGRAEIDAEAGRCEETAYWYLKALCVIAYPLMPGFFAQLWTRLGASGTPSLESFDVSTEPVPGPLQPIATPLSRADLKSCLPVGLLETLA